uniref:Uncharacterized protein n=1 Tax=Strigamia maritima TaxID=126957 RepID=T1J2X3_STRMM
IDAVTPSAPPKPPRISSGVSEPELKKIESNSDPENEDLENVFEDDVQVQPVAESPINIDNSKDDLSINLDLSIFSDLSDPITKADDTKDKFELEVTPVAIPIDDIPKTKKKRPTPPPRYMKIKKNGGGDEISSSPSDWDANNNSLNAELPMDIEKNETNWILANNGEKNLEKTPDSDWDTSISSKEKSPKPEPETKQRLFVKKSDSNRSKRSTGSGRKPDFETETFIPVYKDLTDSESDWSTDEPGGKITVRQTQEVENINPVEKPEKEEMNYLVSKPEVSETNLSPESEVDLISKPEVENFYPIPQEEKIDLNPEVGEVEKTNSLPKPEVEKSNSIQKPEVDEIHDDGSSDWDDSLSNDDAPPNVENTHKPKDTPQGTLGREDTLHGLDEIWEKNPSVEIRSWNQRKGPASTSSEDSSMHELNDKMAAMRERDSGIYSPIIGKGNVAFKKNLFEARNVSVDVAALEAILQNQLAEQQRRLNQRPENSYRFELQRRRHSVDLVFPTINAKSYKALLAQKNVERPKSAESNFSEPIGNKDGNDNVYKASLAMAGISSDEELRAKPEVESGKSPVRKRKSMLSLGKFPTLKKLTKKFMKSESKEEIKVSADEKVIEKEDFVEEVLERLDIRRKSNASLYEAGIEKKDELRKTPSLEIVSESLSFSSSEDESVDEMSENRREKTEDVIANDSGLAAVKLQDFIRDLRLQLEREKGERQVLLERVQSVVGERDQLEAQYEGIRKDFCNLREANAVLEAKMKTNEWELQHSENRWKECDRKLKQMLTHVNTKEESLLNEISRRQQSEMGNQALISELCTVKETLIVLHNECKQLQKEHLSQSEPASPSWASSEMRNKELGAFRKQLDEANQLCQQVMGENQTLQLHLNSQKMEASEWKRQVEQLQCTLESEREKMQREVIKARDGQKVEEDALKESTLGYMVQVNTLQSENNGLRCRLEESAQRIAVLESEMARHVESATAYREELFVLRKTFDESQKNFNLNHEEQARLRKRLEVDLELVCKENGELKENLRNSVSNVVVKNNDVLSPQLNRRANNEMEQLRNQVSLLHDEMSFMKRQIRSNAPSDHSDHHLPISNTSSVRSQTASNKLCQTIPWSLADPTESKRRKMSVMNNSVLSLNGTSEDEQQVVRELEERISSLTVELEKNVNKVHSLEVALVAAQDIIDKVNEEKLELMQTQTLDAISLEEMGKMQQTITQLESETKELRIQSEEVKMHSHKLQDELLRVRLDYKHSEERLMDETNKKLEILNELETNREKNQKLLEDVEILKEEREKLIRRFDDGMEEQKRLWQVEARGRAELALRLLDSEQNKSRILSPGGDAYNAKIVIQRKDEELDRERNRCAKIQDELADMKHKMESVDLSQEISSQITDLEHQVLELKCYISHEQETHQRDRNRLKKAKESLHCVPDLRKQIAQLEHVRDELRAELIRFQSYVKENYVERDEMKRFKADCEARANRDYQTKVTQIKARFDRKDKIEHEKLNNELQLNKNDAMEELNRVKDALRESEMAVEMLRDQLAHVQEMYTAEVNLRAKMSRLNEEKMMEIGDIPFVMRNNQMKHLRESNKRLKSRKSREEVVESSESNDMMYKVRAALDKSVEKYLLNVKY